MLKILVPREQHSGEAWAAFAAANRVDRGSCQGDEGLKSRQALMSTSEIAVMSRDDRRQAGGLL